MVWNRTEDGRIAWSAGRVPTRHGTAGAVEAAAVAATRAKRQANEMEQVASGPPIDQIEHLLSIPSDFSVPYLKIWPDYDPLRERPRFEAVLKKYEKEHGT